MQILSLGLRQKITICKQVFYSDGHMSGDKGVYNGSMESSDIRIHSGRVYIGNHKGILLPDLVLVMAQRFFFQDDDGFHLPLALHLVSLCQRRK